MNAAGVQPWSALTPAFCPYTFGQVLQIDCSFTSSAFSQAWTSEPSINFLWGIFIFPSLFLKQWLCLTISPWGSIKCLDYDSDDDETKHYHQTGTACALQLNVTTHHCTTSVFSLFWPMSETGPQQSGIWPFCVITLIFPLRHLSGEQRPASVRLPESPRVHHLLSADIHSSPLKTHSCNQLAKALPGQSFKSSLTETGVHK